MESVCGNDTPDTIGKKVDVTIAHSDEEVTIEFQGEILNGKDACDASWGVDNVQIFVR